MKLNPRKTHLIIISRSKTLYPPLTLCGLDLEIYSFLKFLGVTLHVKLTFEKHIHNIAISIVQKNGLMLQES